MEPHIVLAALGGLFLLGIAVDYVGRRTQLPRVTMLMLLGVMAGPVGFDIVPPQVAGWYEVLAAVALMMIAFLLGGTLSRATLQRHGRAVLVISAVVVGVTLVAVGGGLWALGVAPILALLFAGIATATDPAATQDVIHQSGARGGFVDTTKGIVAIDDAWGLIAFSFVLIAADMLVGNDVGATLYRGVWELFGAIAVGAAIGFPAAYLTGRLRSGEPMLIEALAIVFLCSGVALWLEVSFLLAGIVAGMVVTNFARHHTRPFHMMERIEWPFMIVFFFVAGATFQTQHWSEFAFIAVAFILLRAVSRVAGGWLGGRLSRAPDSHGRWIGVALMPQAGVAVGMALVAGDHFPDLRDVLLTVTIGTTIAFEVIGPVGTRIALAKTGQIQKEKR